MYTHIKFQQTLRHTMKDGNDNFKKEIDHLNYKTNWYKKTNFQSSHKLQGTRSSLVVVVFQKIAEGGYVGLGHL